MNIIVFSEDGVQTQTINKTWGDQLHGHFDQQNKVETPTNEIQ